MRLISILALLLSTSAFAQPVAPKTTSLPAKAAAASPVAKATPKVITNVVLNVWDWGSYYLPSVQDSLSGYLLDLGYNVKFQYSPTSLTTAAALATALKQQNPPTDIVFPSSYFFTDHPELSSLVHPIPTDSIPEYSKVNPTFQEFAPRASAKELSCFPTFGGFMNLFYKKELAATAPKNFSVFTDPQYKGKYAIPSYSPWYLAYITYEILKTPLNERFTVASLKNPQFRQQFKLLVANAGLVYDNYPLDDAKFNKMSVLLGWGFKIPATWMKADLTVPKPFYMDCMSLTRTAAADKNKLQVFNLMAGWFTRSSTQELLVKNIEGFNMTRAKLDKKDFYRGIKPEENAELKALHILSLVGAKR